LTGSNYCNVDRSDAPLPKLRRCACTTKWIGHTGDEDITFQHLGAPKLFELLLVDEAV
jgi:hypothetical protein